MDQSTLQSTLQVSTHGAWRNVLSFDSAREAEIVAALGPLQRALPRANWCLVLPTGKRQWLLAPAPVLAEPGPAID